MSRNFKFEFLMAYIAPLFLILFGCNVRTTAPTPLLTQTATQSALQTMISLPSVTSVPTGAPKLNTEAPILTPDNLFSISGLETLNTPNSSDFCEHIPAPEIVKNNKNPSLLSGRFSLCIWTAWQNLIKPVIDLDQGVLVAADDPKGDIALAMSHQGLDRVARYYVVGVNKAKIDEIEADDLSLSRCENLLALLNPSDAGILNIHEGAVACVTTTENQVVLIKVDSIYPLETQAVGFSYTMLEK